MRRSDPGWSVIGPILADPYPRSVEPPVIEITTVAAGGDGLGRDEADAWCSCPAPCRGSRSSVELVQQKKDFARGRLLEVVQASADRVEPPCPFVAAGCGGCDWQHAAPSAQRRLKAAVVADALRRQAHLEVAVDEGPELPADRLPDDPPRRGRAAGGSGCGAGAATRSSTSARAWWPTRSSTSWWWTVASPTVRSCSGPAPGTGERLVIVDGSPTATTVPEGVRVTSSAELSAGRRAWFHDELAGHRWRISARSFFQARADGAEALVDAVRRAVDGALAAGRPPRRPVRRCRPLRPHARATDGPVTLVEQSASSAADARVNLGEARRAGRAGRCRPLGTLPRRCGRRRPASHRARQAGRRQGRRHPRRPGRPRELRPGGAGT